FLSPRLDEFPVLREFHDPRVGRATVSVADVNVAVRCDGDVGRSIEGVRAVSGNARCAQRHQDLSVRTELEDLLAPSVCCHVVSYPDVSLVVYAYAVRRDEHPCAKVLHKST